MPQRNLPESAQKGSSPFLYLFFFKFSNPLKGTYVCAAETGSDGIFIGLIGDEPGALGAAAVVRPSARSRTAKKNERFSTSGQQDDVEARLNSLVWACCSIIPKSNDVKAGGVQARQHHGQVVGLGAAVGQVHHLREASARVITASGGGKNSAILG